MVIDRLKSCLYRVPNIGDGPSEAMVLEAQQKQSLFFNR